MLKNTMASLPPPLATGRYCSLPPHLRAELAAVEPSHDGGMPYFPCRAILEEGLVLEAVYLAPEGPYFRTWGTFPDDDKDKNWIPLELVKHVEDSRLRLPARFANELYSTGCVQAGLFAFTVVYSDGSRQRCTAGSAVDFIRHPAGKGPKDVAEVIPCWERKHAPALSAPPYFWCLYSEVSA